MKKQKINIFYILGVLLILAAVGVYFMKDAKTSEANQQMSEIATKIETHLPPRTPGITGSDLETGMPAYSLDGNNYVALLQVKKLGVKLPILSNWKQEDALIFPAKYGGSVYHNTMVIGGSAKKGQMEFLSQLDLDDEILITDMLGGEFSYKVKSIDRASEVTEETFVAEESSLTLFTYMSSEKKYIVVRCEN